MENDSSQPLDYVKGVVEALLFVNEKPVTVDQIKKVLQSVTPTEIKKSIELLNTDYELRSGGVTIQEIAGGYQMLSNPKYVTYVRNFYKTKHKEKLSKPALESLAIIAYKQPVTRADIELIRGVNSDGVVAHLLDKELIKMVGRKDVPGRPFLYGTTKQFLEYFGLKSLDTLPNLQELVALQSDSEHTGSDQPEEGIPQEELAMNTMEQQKQQAIQRAEEAATESSEETPSSDDLSAIDLAAEEIHEPDDNQESLDSENQVMEPQSAGVAGDASDINPEKERENELK